MLKRLWHRLPFTPEPPPMIHIVPMEGVIAAAGRSSRSLNLSAVEGALEKAFKTGEPRAVLLSINSPGGSPVQSRMILQKVRDLSVEHKVPVIAHIQDVGASGGYMLALAGDEIYADPFALVGSIGVIAGGFGLHEAIGRLGIERRVYTAGENKSQLDPFRPEDPRDVAHLKGILDKSHALFIDLVKTRRGDRLKGEDKIVFTGDFWIADEAQALGLIDGVEDRDALLKRRFGDRVQSRSFDVDKRSLLSRLLSGTMPGAWRPEAVAAALEDKALWGRFGR
ncbi:peptidase S49 [Parvularcula bermudensis HTCC2503]|uniref:Peptidase S49 n=1 Tax=Parvularcula bermudensis (strain ATCC BAA-594 / HTCC2503 / KCTC 12087) TaxID=314260 RepID=E0TED2_PARBH|nr:S49 family peptidase [Parvularcula bermudensis]ADM10018.1 peptidase S49 [Parvularcula bermudensis HTCC2503]